MRVGDKVRLLGWEGHIGPLYMGSFRREMVGKEYPVMWLDGDTAWLETPAEFVAWPLSRVEKVGAEG